jgi:hypothetical protein
MPTRVLEIVQRPGQNRSHLRLRETNSMEPAPYAALSYCWGGPQPITTTNASYPRHSLIINKQVLPLSVRDAVLLTEKIGIKYLWIDAFCIFQDDQTDKNWEIVQMPLIYSQATVTIVASRAKGVTEGFLHDRPKMGEETPDHIFELPFLCSDNNLGSVVLLPKVQPPTEPLDLRAWALQERFLSPRIIEYGSLQTRWICQTPALERSIDGFKNMSAFYDERDETDDGLFKLALQNILHTSESAISDDRRRQELLQQWCDMLKIYTHRTLTLGTDRLPAISGIAAQFGRVLCDEYKAGLWKSDMISQLVWIRSATDRRKLKPRPLDYQGPSWSWAAINEPIFATKYPKYRSYTKHVDMEIVDCEIVIKNGAASFSVYDPSFGAVEAASLKLRGRLEKAVCEYDSESHNKVILRKGDATQPQDKLYAGVNLDALEMEFTDGYAGFIPVFLLVVLVGPEPTGLILRHIQGAEFSRLGVFDFDFNRPGRWDREKIITPKQIEWLNSAPVQTITII